MSEVGARLKALRTSKGFTVEDLSKRTGLPVSSIYRYEKGETKSIPAKVLLTLAEELATTVDYLMGQTEDSQAQFFTKLEWNMMESVDAQQLMYQLLVRWGYTVRMSEGKLIAEKDGMTTELDERTQVDTIRALKSYFNYLMYTIHHPGE